MLLNDIGWFDLVSNNDWIGIGRHEAELIAAAAQPLPDDDDDAFD